MRHIAFNEKLFSIYFATTKKRRGQHNSLEGIPKTVRANVIDSQEISIASNLQLLRKFKINAII